MAPGWAGAGSSAGCAASSGLCHPTCRAIDPDEIVVTPSTDRTFVPVLRRAAGLVTADAKPDSHCRRLALELGIPAVVGIREGVEALPDGMHVVLDARRGLVFERPLALMHVED